ncbi:hypothetical protein, partial [Desulfuromonas acetoxidans]|uniref:hypothetical protein n=1 Tax=Desulfuromonas acetoxidans TaxID=891 RepID=UPI003078E220
RRKGIRPIEGGGQKIVKDSIRIALKKVSDDLNDVLMRFQAAGTQIASGGVKFPTAVKRCLKEQRFGPVLLRRFQHP